MSRWKALPASLDQRVWQLVVQMRGLKDRSGLSLASLATKTSYSRSSWERYLNGKKLPPREAVEELARVCGADSVRLVALRDVAAEARMGDNGGAGGAGGASADGPEARAEATGSGEAAPVPALPGPALPGRPRFGRPWRRMPRRRRAVFVAAAVLVALGVGLLVGRPWEGGASTADQRPSQQRVFVFKPGRAHPCEISRKDGLLYAGHSLTDQALLDTNSTSWDVVEAQCLLRRHGYDPGIVDGAYGERSKSAAKRFQKDHELAPDGIVGPDTWKVLRR